MRRLILKNLLSRPVTEAPPAPDEAGLAELLGQGEGHEHVGREREEDGNNGRADPEPQPLEARAHGLGRSLHTAADDTLATCCR